MLLCLYLSLWAELTQPVLHRQPGLSVAAGLYGQAVIAESVPDGKVRKTLVFLTFPSGTELR